MDGMDMMDSTAPGEHREPIDEVRAVAVHGGRVWGTANGLMLDVGERMRRLVRVVPSSVEILMEMDRTYPTRDGRRIASYTPLEALALGEALCRTALEFPEMQQLRAAMDAKDKRRDGGSTFEAPADADSDLGSGSRAPADGAAGPGVRGDGEAGGQC